MRSAPKEREELRARAEITSHFAAGPQARWRGASDELYPGRYVRSEQQSQRACGPQPEGARRRRARIGFVAAPRRCPTSPSSRRLASARPALAPKCEFISARALSRQFHHGVSMILRLVHANENGRRGARRITNVIARTGRPLDAFGGDAQRSHLLTLKKVLGATQSGASHSQARRNRYG